MTKSFDNSPSRYEGDELWKETRNKINSCRDRTITFDTLKPEGKIVRVLTRV